MGAECARAVSLDGATVKARRPFRQESIDALAAFVAFGGAADAGGLGFELVGKAVGGGGGDSMRIAPSAPVGATTNNAAVRSISASNSVAETVRVTSPMSAASAAPTLRLVMIISCARRSPARRGRLQLNPPSGVSPIAL